MRGYLKIMLMVFFAMLIAVGCSGEETNQEANNSSNQEENDSTNQENDNSSNENENENNSSNEGEEVTLEFYSTLDDDEGKDLMEEIIAEFEEEHQNITIKPSFPGQEYENLLRVKMASEDLPDLFDTHGWAIQRYGEYIEDLSDMDWAEHLDPAMEPILVDDAGKIYALPLNQAKDGLTYNATILEEFEIEPPKTFDEFMDALREIKSESDGEIVPFWFAGSEQWHLAQYFDQFATPLLVTHEDHNYEEELLDGSFD